jgi:hypothetical protein
VTISQANSHNRWILYMIPATPARGESPRSHRSPNSYLLPQPRFVLRHRLLRHADALRGHVRFSPDHTIRPFRCWMLCVYKAHA